LHVFLRSMICLWGLRERIRSGELIGEEDAIDEKIWVPA